MVAGFYFMRFKGLTNKKIKKIAASVSLAAFSLFAVAVGAYAWFTASILSQINGDTYEVVRVSKGGGIESVNFIKFEYPKNRITHKYDYTDPKEGAVVRYSLEDGIFVDEHGNTTDTMTTYDPAEKIIYGDSFSLFNTNCAALYEITINTEDYGDYTLDITGILDPDAEKITNRDIFLSDCADFCVFKTSDISTPIGINPDTDKPYYYPTYIEYDNPSTDMSDLENLYYRLSYQQSIKTGDALKHFYKAPPQSKATEIPLETSIPVTFSQSQKNYTIYVCVNYAPDQLENYYKDIYHSDMKAIFDYYFSFELTKVEG